MPTKRALMIGKAKIDYGAWVELGLRPSGALGDRGGPIHNGSLSSAVLAFLRLPETMQPFAIIRCGRAVQGAGGLLKPDDIRAIARRSDCPKE